MSASPESPSVPGWQNRDCTLEELLEDVTAVYLSGSDPAGRPGSSLQLQLCTRPCCRSILYARLGSHEAEGEQDSSREDQNGSTGQRASQPASRQRDMANTTTALLENHVFTNKWDNYDTWAACDEMLGKSLKKK